ncbi:hypothetical protein CDIK_0620 [Cucumispora dikerogammari]|nr:hypothetical protein CDIK_0620 [Cucumispora dikerogammari]
MIISSIFFLFKLNIIWLKRSNQQNERVIEIKEMPEIRNVENKEKKVHTILDSQNNTTISNAELVFQIEFPDDCVPDQYLINNESNDKNPKLYIYFPTIVQTGRMNYSVDGENYRGKEFELVLTKETASFYKPLSNEKKIGVVIKEAISAILYDAIKYGYFNPFNSFQLQLKLRIRPKYAHKSRPMLLFQTPILLCSFKNNKFAIMNTPKTAKKETEIEYDKNSMREKRLKRLGADKNTSITNPDKEPGADSAGHTKTERPKQDQQDSPGKLPSQKILITQDENSGKYQIQASKGGNGKVRKNVTETTSSSKQDIQDGPVKLSKPKNIKTHHENSGEDQTQAPKGVNGKVRKNVTETTSSSKNWLIILIISTVIVFIITGLVLWFFINERYSRVAE